ncbi:N-methyl-L-tryptophan oxidase [Bacillus sp. ISL-47]|uniref:N-methyl-L-tryptophan oxidase n=1 Tax=Bacillus sp. ISL-47 TaxID=2819130 RepID=UPI001BE8DB80|nr:N-methyl-L-tryptophan oxidase [Bacillus sp. ISL-47]MBT2686729.1 N-methyl-L-tryptophan oxidase [Bacillus sp. ISL-47]MBT2706923.1 N-methyl-L-tryptophan oxidase [Pseudomonas sp. ISL-84]
MDADVGIIGLGTMGSMAMWQLAKSGASVIGFEQFGVGHDRSAAGGESRIFRTAYKEGTHYVPLLKDAYKLWRNLEEESGNPLLTLTSGLIIGHPETADMKNVYKSIQEYHLDHEVLNWEEAGKRYPQHRLQKGEQIIIDKLSGYLRPQLSIVSAVQRARDLGAEIHSHTAVDHIKSERDGVTIFAGGKTFKVRKVLVTAGPWAVNFMQEFADFMDVRRLVNAWFLPRKANHFCEENFPVFTREREGFYYYGFPSVDGNMVKIGMFTTEKSRISSPDSLDRAVDLKELAAFAEIIEKDLPGLYPDPSRVNSYMEIYTADRHPVIGTSTGQDRIIYLTGFSGHGFKLAPVMGKIGAELALYGKTDYHIEPFSPARFIREGSV